MLKTRTGRDFSAPPLALVIRQRPTLPGTHVPSTIGAGGLNFRVRNGNGCDPTAITTGNLDARPLLVKQNLNCQNKTEILKISIANTSTINIYAISKYQALGRLVPVG